MNQVQKDQEEAYTDGRKGILYSESHPNYESNKRAFETYKPMRIYPSLAENLDYLLD